MNKMEVLVIMGSKSDHIVMKKATNILHEFGIYYGLHIASAHRTPKKIDELVREAEEKGCKVIIAGAGMAAHLPGVIASKTLIPVLGVPLPCNAFINGMDALLSIVQMPPGIPVACMGVGKAGVKNAALYAIQILATNNQDLKEKLILYRVEMEMQVERDDCVYGFEQLWVNKN
jgi:5-(carboxyamino)imidazole ribonucleotide mutase